MLVRRLSQEHAMRITGGTYRGRRITCPPGVIRPAMDRMRESLFSILGPLNGISFLDLFAGSGAVGLEAASRGAHPVHLVEMDKKKRHVILKNIHFADPPLELFMMPVQRYLKRCSASYDIVYADPPFPMKNKASLLVLAAEHAAVRTGGLFIIHHPSEELWEDEIACFCCTDVRTYGRSVLRFYRNEITDTSQLSDTH